LTGWMKILNIAMSDSYFGSLIEERDPYAQNRS
jgi:hypothetical protein